MCAQRKTQKRLDLFGNFRHKERGEKRKICQENSINNTFIFIHLCRASSFKLIQDTMQVDDIETYLW